MRMFKKEDKDVKVTVEKNTVKGKIVAICPFISLIAFLLLGFLGGWWHPGWIVFLLTPIVSMIVYSKQWVQLVFIAIVVATYILLGLLGGWWHPAWIIFLTIPIFSILFPKGIIDFQKKEKKEKEHNFEDMEIEEAEFEEKDEINE